ncbi:WD domain, G-beta repeat protein [Cooperia oncophora]
MSWPGPSDPSDCQIHNGATRNFGLTVPNGHPKKHKTAERLKIFRQWLADTDEDERKLLIRGALLNDCDLPNLEYISMLISRLRVARSRPTTNGSKDPLTLLPSHIVLRIMAYLDPGLKYTFPVKFLSCLEHLYTFILQFPSAEVLVYLAIGALFVLNLCYGERYANYHVNFVSVLRKQNHRSYEATRPNVVQFDGKKRSLNATDFGEIGTQDGHAGKKQKMCLLVSGSNDFSIKVWNVDVNPRWSSIGCRMTMLGHSNYVRCLQMDHEHLISGSYDMHLKLWSLNTGACVRTLVGHNDSVLCVQYRDRDSLAVSGSADNSIKCWDTRTGRPEMTIHNAHDNAVTCVRFDDHRIVSGSVDRNDKNVGRTNGKMHAYD